jgi:acyl phosphate:glycerol-3-phosphate acyltransferase
VTTTVWLTSVGLIVLAYLFGSLSPSVFLGKACKGIDVRKVGSGNAGTTNAFRALGVKLGIAVLFLDVLKGVVPVVIARLVLHDEHPVVIVLAAFVTIIGHNYSVFLRGKGGKGVATGAGAAIALMPIPMAIVVGVFVVLLLTVRVVSVSSIVATIMYPVMAAVFQRPLAYIIGACIMSAVVLYAHRGNARRIWRRQEPRVRFPWNKPKCDGRASAAAAPPATCVSTAVSEQSSGCADSEAAAT